MTGVLSRRTVAVLGLATGVVAICVAWLLVGAAGVCGFHENQIATGYCAASSAVRTLLIACLAMTVAVGYVISLRMARLTPIAVAAFCAVAEGLVALVSGW
jgi:hypothetical protein